MGGLTHRGSKKKILGEKPPPELPRGVFNKMQVTKDTPPCFLFHTFEDKVVPMENSLNFVAALRKAGVPFELHTYEHGAHGVGLGSKVYGGGERHAWTIECARWLKERGFAK